MSPEPGSLSRRRLLAGVSVLALAGGAGRYPDPGGAGRYPGPGGAGRYPGPGGAGPRPDPVSAVPARARPLPLRDVRLLPSRWRDAVERNRTTLLDLDPDRLLYPFRTQAGLPTACAPYGGWESDTIAGHTLGHVLSALSLLHAQTGDPAAAARVAVLVRGLGEVQRAQGDGYVAGFTRREPDDTLSPGKRIFAEIARGRIRSTGFDLNGAWSPLYNLHKTMAGLLDAHALCGSSAALAVATGLAGFLARNFAVLDDDALQRVLACEYGGLNESFAELFARTGDRRWLRVAERLGDRAVLGPLARGIDDLPDRHANTQIPKLIGLARIHALGGGGGGEGRGGDDDGNGNVAAVAPRFFWDAVTAHHSYVIGGNADREYFAAPDTIARHVTEQTCEHCNSYNMLKLTRALYAARPDARLFDFYERTHLNHVLAAHHPRTGMFTYMTPLLSGAAREWSTPEHDFWCCVGTGFESHAKHGDSIFWEDGDTLLVNLFIPARARWRSRGAGIELLTRYPDDGAVRLRIATLDRPRRFALALRIPAWAGSDVALRLNGAPVLATAADRGYLLLHRTWHPGDAVDLLLPMPLRTESPADDPRLVSVLRGPVVLAADLGPATAAATTTTDGVAPYAGIVPALVTDDVVSDLRPAVDDPSHWITATAGRPTPLRFVPFHAQYDRRSAVYLRRFTEAEWVSEQREFLAGQQRERDLAARSIDVLHLGEMQPEHDHVLRAVGSYPLVYRNRRGRDLRAGGSISFRFRVRSGPLSLFYTTWRDDRSGGFTVRVDGQVVATVPPGTAPGTAAGGGFVDAELPLPPGLTANRSDLSVRFESSGSRTAGPFLLARLLAPPGAVAA